MRKVSAFSRDERGAQTIEFILWVPVLVALVIILVDAATLYLTHTEMTAVARDTARRMTTGELASRDEAEEYAAGAMELRSYTYLVNAVYDPENEMRVAIGMSYADISILGYSTLEIFGGTLTAKVAMRPDPHLVTAGDKGKGKGKGNGNGRNK